MAKKNGKSRGKNGDPASAIDASRVQVDPAKLAGKSGEAVLKAQAPEAPEIVVDGVPFDLDDPVFPPALDKRALSSGGYPYEEEIKNRVYEDQLKLLQLELVKLQKWVVDTGARVVALFEGRDAAGKGGTVVTFRAFMNPRSCRAVALPKPTDAERGQWYFQRYVSQLPTRGEIVMFDRSWYNRAVVEPVMGFCTPEETTEFLDQVPRFEKLLVDDGIILVKFWLDLGREMQLKRFHDRRHDPLKIWKLSPVDIKALALWKDTTAARDRMFKETDTEVAPWTVIRSNDKKRARLNAIRHLLRRVDYDGKTPEAIGDIDPNLIGRSSLVVD